MAQRPERAPLSRRRFFILSAALAAAAPLSACSAGGGLPEFTGRGAAEPPPLPPPSGRTIGRGPVRVALLLPLSGDAALAAVGTSMANAAQLAIEAIEKNPALPGNVTILLKDTGTTTSGATQAATQALGEGVSLILGPLRADQVTATGAVARTAGVPVIGFSNNTGAAGPGVYLLNVLPETEVRRAMSYVQRQGRRAFAAIVPTTDFGRIQLGAFRQAGADLGLNIRAIYEFSSEAEARTSVQQVAPLLLGGSIDTLFLPDRATAPSFAVLLEEARVAASSVAIVGSADWNADPGIAATPFLAGAIHPAVDDAGYQALLAEYRSRFGDTPHALATIGYTAVTLANTSALAMASPRYDRARLTAANGFSGRDGAFRFHADGRSDYALVIKQVTPGGARVVDAARL